MLILLLEHWVLVIFSMLCTGYCLFVKRQKKINTSVEKEPCVFNFANKVLK